MQSIGVEYGHQQYENVDMKMKQLRYQNQTTIDQINCMTSALRSLKNKNKMNETLIKELKKQHKDAEHERDKAKIDLELTEYEAIDAETMANTILISNIKLNSKCLIKNGRIINCIKWKE